MLPSHLIQSLNYNFAIFHLRILGESCFDGSKQLLLILTGSLALAMSQDRKLGKKGTNMSSQSKFVETNQSQIWRQLRERGGSSFWRNRLCLNKARLRWFHCPWAPRPNWAGWSPPFYHLPSQNWAVAADDSSSRASYLLRMGTLHILTHPLWGGRPPPALVQIYTTAVTQGKVNQQQPTSYF